jgi:hypothetical protein
MSIPIKGNHPTLGLCTAPTQHNHWVQLIGMEKGIPAHKIPRWKSTIRRSIILQFNGKPVASEDDIKNYVALAQNDKLSQVTITFATVQPQPLHPTEGSLMLYYDQMNVIAAHLQQAYPDKYNPSQNRQEHSYVNQLLDTGPTHDSFQSPSNGTNMPAEQDLGKSFTL